MSNNVTQKSLFGEDEAPFPEDIASVSDLKNPYASDKSSKPKGDYNLKYDNNHKTQPGDIWQIGTHRLMCGDSRRSADIKKLCGGKTVQLIHSDPPYNVGVQPAGDWGGNSEKRGRKKADAEIAKERPLQGDFITAMDFNNRLIWWFRGMNDVLDSGRSFYIWGGFSNLGNYPQCLRAGRFHWHQLIIWVKSRKVLTRLDFMGQHEICFYGWKAKKGFTHKCSASGISDVWYEENVPGPHMVHLTEKPVAIPQRAIEYSSDEGEIVFDSFGGSGSTLIAAENLNRKALLMEIDVTYCEVILARCNYLGMDIKKVES